MMKRFLHNKLSKTTLLAFATFLIVIPAATAMPMSSDPGATRGPVVSFHAQPLADGWYPAALRSTQMALAQGDGWYTMPNPTSRNIQALAEGDGWYTMPNPTSQVVAAHKLSDGWYPAAARETQLALAQGDGWYTMPNPSTITSAGSGSSFDYRNAFIAFAIALLLTAVLTAGVLRARRERHIPVLQ